MATNIREITNSIVLLQRGNGVPIHISPRSTLFFDLDTPKVYINRNGVADWSYLLDSSATISSGDTYVTGFTYDNQNNLTIYRNDGVNLTTNINVFTGLTVVGSVSATTFYGDGSNLSGISSTNYYTTGTTLIDRVVYFNRNDTISAYTLNLSSFTTYDTYVTGGTYSNGTTIFRNNSGNTFNVTGFYTGSTDVFVTGGTPNNGSKVYTFTNNTGGTFTVTGLTDIRITGVTFSNNTLTLTNNTGGTVSVLMNSLTGLTITNLTANTISATTYLNLPTDIRVTGGTYTAGTTTFKNNTGGTFNVSGYYTGTTDVYTTGLTFNNSTFILSNTRNDGTVLTANLSILSSDVTITGGSYNQVTGIATFFNNSGATFNVSGFTTGITDTRVSSLSYSNNILTLIDSTGGTFNTLINTTTGLTNSGLISTGSFSATTITAGAGAVSSTYTADIWGSIGLRGNQSVIGTEISGIYVRNGASSNTNVAAKIDFELGSNVDRVGIVFSTQNIFGSLLERMRISPAGLVGIGTSGATNNLEVVGSISATTYLGLPTDIRITGITNSNNLITLTNNTGGTISTLFNTTTGLTNSTLISTGTLSATSIGVGLAPASLAYIETLGSQSRSSAKFGSVEIQSYSVNNNWIGDNLYNSGSGNHFTYRSNGYMSMLNFGQDLRFYTAPSGATGTEPASLLTAKLVILNGGNVGIGTTAPVSKLDILSTGNVKTAIFASVGAVSTAPTTIISSNYLNLGMGEFNLNSYRLIGFGYNAGLTLNSPAYIGYQETEVGTSTKGDLIFGTRPTSTNVEPTERMRITSNGNVGIGTTSPSVLFEVNKSQNATTGIQLLNGTNGTTARTSFLLGESASAGHYGYLAHLSRSWTPTVAFEEAGSTLLFGGSDGDLNLVGGQNKSINLWVDANSGTWFKGLVLSSNGNVGIGVAAPTAKLHLTATTEQLRIGYNTSNYYSTTVGSTGGVVFDAVGAGASFTFNNPVNISVVSATTLYVSTAIIGIALNTTANITANSGSTVVCSIPMSSYTGGFFEYVVSDGVNARAGSMMSVWLGGNITNTEVYTTDIGNTSTLSFSLTIVGSNVVLTAIATTSGWTVKMIIRSI